MTAGREAGARLPPRALPAAVLVAERDMAVNSWQCLHESIRPRLPYPGVSETNSRHRYPA